jgi:bifunctional non-homologous end joining protein LigD
MSLTRYKSKRDFKVSPEPTGGESNTDKLRFVVQKHDASHLHYDFRLEMDGVLKSWAVPKGPSIDSSVKRLAVQVEDHPYDYRNFEGIIPEGYGAGTVMVWDEGFYEPANEESLNKSDQDKKLRQELNAGKLTIVLYGKKLKGEFALIKSRGRGEKSWLLFKVKDKYENRKDILLSDKSVLSKKTLRQIEKTSTNIHKAHRGKRLTRQVKKNNLPKKILPKN